VATLADSMLIVPAHGTASTTVTGDGSKAPVGNTSGQIVASVGGTPVAHTAFGLVKEEERYTLTVHVKDRAGDPTAAYLAVQQLAEGVDPYPEYVGDSGTLKLRLTPGTYSVTSFLDVHGSHGADSLGLGFLAAPEITLDQDREVTLDGTKLKEIPAKVDRRTETRQLMLSAPLDMRVVYRGPVGAGRAVPRAPYGALYRTGLHRSRLAPPQGLYIRWRRLPGTGRRRHRVLPYDSRDSLRVLASLATPRGRQTSRRAFSLLVLHVWDLRVNYVQQPVACAP